jgi:penicillin amidase
MRRVFVLFVLTTTICATVLTTGGTSTAAPPGDRLTVPGLVDQVSVSRDTNGIAHVRAGNEHDLFLAAGWVQAQDRLFQMDVNRRQPSGTLAELLGAGALPGDVQARTIGLRRAAARSLPALSQQSRDDLDAFAAGVNAWVAAHPQLTPEYAALKLATFTPWTSLDSVVVGKALAFGLSFDLDIDATIAYQHYLATGAALGFNGDALFREDTNRSAPFAQAATVPDASAAVTGQRPQGARADTGPSVPQLDATTLRLAERWRAQLQGANPLLAQRLDAMQRPGSNEWGIAGSLSNSGHPLLANDPHLSLGAPSTFYPIHLTAGPIDVAGNTFAGAPFVVLGHNKHVMWGATTNPMDVTDTYQEKVVLDPTSPSGYSTVYLGALEHVIAVPEAYRVNSMGSGVVPAPPSPNIPPATLVVPRRNNGPIVSLAPPTPAGAGTGLSVQYTGFSATRELDTFRLWDAARNLDDFRDGLTYFDVGSQNFSYADGKGHLAYFTSAEMPLREDLQAGSVNGAPPWFIRNGQGGNEWLPRTTTYAGQAIPYEILPPAEMPHVVDPPAGYFVSANNDPVGTTFDNNPLNQFRPDGGIYYLNVGYDGLRAARITEMVRAALDSGRKLTTDDLARMQSDVTLIDAEALVPYLLAAYDHAKAAGAGSPLAGLAADPRVNEAVGRLREWDFTTPTGIEAGYDAADVNGQRATPSPGEVASSVAAAIYAVWRGQLLAHTIDGTVRSNGLGAYLPDADAAMASLRHFLDTFEQTHGVGASGLHFFNFPGIGDPAAARDAVLLSSLRSALDAMASDAFAPAFGGSTDQADYEWGKLHRHVFGHLLGGPWNIPPSGGFTPSVPGLTGVSTDGGYGTVDAASHNPRADSLNGFMFGSGPVRRFVGEARPGRPYAQTSLPGGASGVLGDPHYADLLGRWLTDDSYRQLLRGPGLAKTFTTTTFLIP